MDLFLYLVGTLLIIASVVLSAIFSVYGLLIFPVIPSFACIIIGLGKIIRILEEIKTNKLK